MSDTTASPVEGRIAISTRTALTVIVGAALMTLAAKVQVPFWPVPMTLHTLAIMTFAVAFGPRIAISIFLTYLAAALPACRSSQAPRKEAWALPTWLAPRAAISSAISLLPGSSGGWRSVRVPSVASVLCWLECYRFMQSARYGSRSMFPSIEFLPLG
jgi:hypothetical protein